MLDPQAMKYEGFEMENGPIANEKKGPIENADQDMIAIVEEIQKTIAKLAGEHNLKNAIVIFTKGDLDPTAWWNGPFYETAQMVAATMRKFKDKVAQELDC